MTQHLTVARVANSLGVAWHTANTTILTEGHQMLISDPTASMAAKGH